MNRQDCFNNARDLERGGVENRQSKTKKVGEKQSNEEGKAVKKDRITAIGRKRKLLRTETTGQRENKISAPCKRDKKKKTIKKKKRSKKRSSESGGGGKGKAPLEIKRCTFVRTPKKPVINAIRIPSNFGERRELEGEKDRGGKALILQNPRPKESTESLLNVREKAKRLKSVKS